MSYKSLFKLGSAYAFGVNCLDEMEGKIDGRIPGAAHDYGILAQMVHDAGHGDYLEIGTMYGVSAIIAARTKKEYNLSGSVVCVDPMDGYYGESVPDQATPEKLFHNARLFDVEVWIELIQKHSQPWPGGLEGRRFACTFIDGYHWGRIPLMDFRCASTCTDRFILFDNYDSDHRDVVRATIRATMIPWIPVYVGGISFLLEKYPEIDNPYAERMNARNREWLKELPYEWFV